VCVLCTVRNEYIFRLGYFSGFFLFVVIVLTIMLHFTLRRIGLLYFYFYFESRANNNDVF
jgi:hypothetical protein